MSDQPHCPGKQAWPELLGAEAQKAKAIIERENPLVKVAFLTKGEFRTHDYRCDRVFLWTTKHEAGTVIEIPTVG